jgi:hypothetical protein
LSEVALVAEFHPDYAGIAAILGSEQVRELLRDAAREVAFEVEARGHTVEDGSLLPVEVRDEADTDSAAVSVAIPHAAGVGMEARYGLLKRAAASIGLRAKGFRKPHRSRKRKRS